MACDSLGWSRQQQKVSQKIIWQTLNSTNVGTSWPSLRILRATRNLGWQHLCGWIASVGISLQRQDLLQKEHHILAAAGGKSTNSRMHLQRKSLCPSNNLKLQKYTIHLALLLTGTIDIAKMICESRKRLKREIGRFALIYQSLPWLLWILGSSTMHSKTHHTRPSVRKRTFTLSLLKSWLISATTIGDEQLDPDHLRMDHRIKMHVSGQLKVEAPAPVFSPI